MKIKETTDKYMLLWSAKKIGDALRMLKGDLKSLGVVDGKNVQLLIITMDNLFNSIIDACETIRNIRKEERIKNGS